MTAAHTSHVPLVIVVLTISTLLVRFGGLSGPLPLGERSSPRFEVYMFNKAYLSSDASIHVSNLGSLIRPEKKLPFRIYCCSMYFNEVYIFAIKAIMMSQWIHKFVLATSIRSHSSMVAVNVTFAPFDDVVKALGERLFVYSGDVNSHGSWSRESEQRNLVQRALDAMGERPDKDDLFMLSDFDEFFDDEAMEQIVANPPRTFYKTKCYMFMYSLRWRRILKTASRPRTFWVHPIIARFSYAWHTTPQKMWESGGALVPNVTGYHMTYILGSIEAIQRKLRGFAHTEYSSPPCNEPNRLYTRMTCGLALFHNDPFHPGAHQFELVPRWNTSQYPMLAHPLLSWANSRVPFIRLSPLLNETAIANQIPPPCHEAIEALHDFRMDRSD